MLPQNPEATVQTDLQNHGWKADQVTPNGPWLPYTMDFTDDDSLWVAFPSEAPAGLRSRNVPAEYKGTVLHIAPTGAVIKKCETPALRWNSLRLFATRTNGFVLDTAEKLISYDVGCEQRGVYSTDERTEVSPSPDRRLVYIRTRDNHINVLDSDNLAVLHELDLPASVKRNQVLFGDRLVAYPITTSTKACYQNQFWSMEIANATIARSVTIECARFNLLGDSYIVYSDNGGNGPLRIIGGADATEYKPPRNEYIDLSVLGDFPVASAASLRIAEELIEAKGKHPSTDTSGKFVGKSIVLLDMHKGVALLTVKLPMNLLTYAYALSRDGKRFAVQLNSQLTVYQLP